MSQDPSAPAAAGQISADGQFRWDGEQWVPLAPGYREPTPWTRRMQLAAAALFALTAIYSVTSAFLFINHDSLMRSIKAQGLPAGSDIETAVSIGIAFAYGFVIFFALLEVVAAIGSYLGWRWMFWAAMVLFGVGGIGAFTNLSTVRNPDTSPVPIAGVLIGEVFSLLSLAMFIWMLVGVIKYGPWAMKKPAP